MANLKFEIEMTTKANDISPLPPGIKIPEKSASAKNRRSKHHHRKLSRTPRITFFSCFWFFCNCYCVRCYCLFVCVQNAALRKLKLFKAVIDVDQIHQNVNWLLAVGFHKIHSLSSFVVFIFFLASFVSFSRQFLFEFHIRYNLVDMRL